MNRFLLASLLIFLPTISFAQRDLDRDGFRFSVRSQVSPSGSEYLYQYTVRQVDNGRVLYQDINRFSLVFPCGDSGYRTVRNLQLDGWTIDSTGYYSEPVLRSGSVWELTLKPGYSLTPDGDGTGRGERTFTFSFLSSCAPENGQWVAVGTSSDDYGDVDVPCSCSSSQREPTDRTRSEETKEKNRGIFEDDRDNSRSDRNASNRDIDQINRERNQDELQQGKITVTRSEIVVSPDTTLKLRMLTRLSSATSKVGDRFKAELLEDLKANGLNVLPEGTLVEGRVTSVTPAQSRSRSGTIAIDFDRLILPSGRAIAVSGELTSLDPKEREQIDNEGRVGDRSSTKRKVVFIGGGAAGGAAIGAIAGGGKGAGIGAAIGAGVGVLGVLISK
ncbi:MAG: hypothetical protein JNN15_11410, partial [Blastocatellia bacterium]|nr:hypothetical protein [Blastocatellia bacterium]